MEIILLPIFAVYWIIQQTAASPTVPKSETLQCSKSQEDMNLPHEVSCSQYYRCIYLKKIPKVCPEGMVFNKEIANCDFAYNVVECLDRNIEHTQDFTHIIKESINFNSKEENLKVKKDSTGSSTILDKRFVYLPHENDPNSYYKFENGKKLLKKCRPRQEFDFNLEVCVKVPITEKNKNRKSVIT